MEDLIKELNSAEYLDFETSFSYAQICSSLLGGEEVQGRRLIINILNHWNKIHPETTELWTDIIEAAGFYPYIEKNRSLLKLNNISGEIRKGLHRSEKLNKYFHDEQFELLKLLEAQNNLIVSAPTSFGKSLLIEEVIASRRYSNVVVIQPTLALLDETRRKLIKYTDYYKLIVRTSQEPSQTHNIFLFTAERVNEYSYFPHIDYLIIDEFYKLSGKRDDERSSSLNIAFYYLMKRFSPGFYLLGPNIDGISKGFAKKYNAQFIKSDYSLVDSKVIDLYKDYENRFGSRGEKKKFKESVLFDLLLELKNEQTIIYCSSPQKVRYLAKEFTHFLQERKAIESKTNFAIIPWIENHLNKNWGLIENLKNTVGIHDGALQKHISSSIIDYFNQGSLRYLFCTSTIIEGVNTSAKNIVYFDEKKGPNDVDYFDYSNIKGRAGRMMEHYVGNIYNFNKPPENKSVIIDIPFFEQNPIKDEVLIQIEESEVIDTNSEQFKALKRIPEEEREVIKRNGIQVHGQKSIFEILRKDISSKYELITWDFFPTYEQLTYVIGMAWDNLIIPGETTRPMTKAKLIKMIFDYGLNKDINSLIASDYTYQRSLIINQDIKDEDLIDNSIQTIFQIIKHWFEYKVPKWLSVMNEIQKFICHEFGYRAGNYTYYGSLIENDFLRENLSILSEYGIPSSAIRKIENRIPSDLGQDYVLEYIRSRNLYQSSQLLDYEKQKIIENLNLNKDR